VETAMANIARTPVGLLFGSKFAVATAPGMVHDRIVGDLPVYLASASHDFFSGKV